MISTEGRSVSIAGENNSENPFQKYAREIKEARIISGYTQEEAALLIGVSKTSLRNWETGRKLPSNQNLLKMNSVYMVKIETPTAISAINNFSRNELLKMMNGILQENEPQGD